MKKRWKTTARQLGTGFGVRENVDCTRQHQGTGATCYGKGSQDESSRETIEDRMKPGRVQIETSTNDVTMSKNVPLILSAHGPGVFGGKEWERSFTIPGVQHSATYMSAHRHQMRLLASAGLCKHEPFFFKRGETLNPWGLLAALAEQTMAPIYNLIR